MVNFEALDDAITWANEHPDEFHMSTWYRKTDCGTTACLAGRVASINGWHPRFVDGAITPVVHTFEDQYGEESIEVAVWNDSGQVRSVRDVAAEVLGLVGSDQDIFFASNLRAVIIIRNEMAAEAGIDERFWDKPAPGGQP